MPSFSGETFDMEYSVQNCTNAEKMYFILLQFYPVK